MTAEEYLKREIEINAAMKNYPQMEVGEAYRKWKEGRGEKAESLSTKDKTIDVAKEVIREAAKKPCTQAGCTGEMFLESVCGGCVEGRAGFKSKWTCEICLYRELSKKEHLEWLRELASSLKASS